MKNQQVYQNMGKEACPKNTAGPNIKCKLEELTRSVSEVYRYELLTTTQYLKQMELVLEIFEELSQNQ
jgi:hypothetical protein